MYRFLDYVLKNLRFRFFRSKYEFEHDYLAANIRFAGHSLESWGKRLSEKRTDFAINRSNISAAYLKKLLAKYDELHYVNSDDIIWAREILSLFENGSIIYAHNHFERLNKLDFDDFMCVVKHRRSIRKWDTNKKVSESDLIYLIESAKWAPSSCNRQTIKFWLVEKDEDRRLVSKIRTGSPNSKLFIEASVVLLVTIDERVYSAREFHATGMDAGAAIQNLMLCAEILGLGTCWVNFQSFKLKDQDVLNKSFNIPSYNKIYAIIPIGYPLDNPEPPVRKENVELLYKIKSTNNY